jgi:hypothetical protein
MENYESVNSRRRPLRHYGGRGCAAAALCNAAGSERYAMCCGKLKIVDLGVFGCYAPFIVHAPLACVSSQSSMTQGSLFLTRVSSRHGTRKK